MLFFVRCTKYAILPTLDSYYLFDLTPPPPNPVAYCVIAAKTVQVMGINKIYFYSIMADDIAIGVYVHSKPLLKM